MILSYFSGVQPGVLYPGRIDFLGFSSGGHRLSTQSPKYSISSGLTSTHNLAQTFCEYWLNANGGVN